MAFSLIDFEHIPWSPGGHPLEQKKVDPNGSAVVLKFAPGFADPNWCPRSHLLFVLEGTLTLEFEHETLTVPRGQACRIDTGTQHRAANTTQQDVVLLAISDL
jgi:mannose-6-phosphate isomerase-like protein (cupin superfamily)